MTGGQLPRWAQPKQDGVPAPDSPLDRQFAAFVGPRWETYRRKFRPFFEEPRFQPTWNWSAALFSPIWFLYRKLYVPFAFFWIAPSLVFGMLWQGEPPKAADMAANPALAEDARLVLLGVQLSAMVLAGGTANYLLFRRARAALTLVQQRAPGGAEQTLALLARLGQVNRVGVGIVLAFMLFGAAMMASGSLGR